MAEAGQKDQTSNEAVAVDNTAPKTLDEVTGFSSGSSAPVVSNPAPEKPKTTQPESMTPVAGAPAAPTEESSSGAPKSKPEDSIGKSAVAEKLGDDALKKSKFIDDTWQDALLRQAWNMDKIDPEIQKFVTSVEQDPKKGTICFKTKHGNFDWGKAQDGSEFIGRHGIFNLLTQEVADEEALVAKTRGWKSVNVHGSEANKERLWLGAKRAGLEVANYTPPENSKALEIWKKENADKLTGLQNAEEAPKNEAPKQAPPKAEQPAAAEPPKNDAPAAPVAAAPTDTAPVVDEPKAAEPPKAEEPKAAATAQEEKPATPVASKFGAAEPPKAEQPAAAEPPKANPAHAQWEKDKALFSSKPEGEEVSREGRMNVESVEGMTKRAAAVQDPTHRAGIEKLQDAIKSGKVSVDGPIEREIINNVDSPKGFQKAADYFGKKASSDLGLPKVDAPTVAAADNTAPQNKASKNKGPV